MDRVITAATLTEDVFLQTSSDLLEIKIGRWERDDKYAADLTQATHDLISELWPVDAPVDVGAYIDVIERDIKKIDYELLRQLVAALADRAKECTSQSSADGSAAIVVANWLKLWIIEQRSDDFAGLRAAKLKRKHIGFLRQVLFDGYAHSVPALPIHQAGRMS